jgi:hypothetical protein
MFIALDVKYGKKKYFWIICSKGLWLWTFQILVNAFSYYLLLSCKQNLWWHGRIFFHVIHLTCGMDHTSEIAMNGAMVVEVKVFNYQGLHFTCGLDVLVY